MSQLTQYLDFSTGNNYLDESIENYLMHGVPPGGFLGAVLVGDLFLAASRADHWNKPRLAEIALAIYHSMPPYSFGRAEIVRSWLDDVNGVRTNYAAKKEKEFTWKSLKGEVNGKVTDPPF